MPSRALAAWVKGDTRATGCIQPGSCETGKKIGDIKVMKMPEMLEITMPTSIDGAQVPMTSATPASDIDVSIVTRTYQGLRWTLMPKTGASSKKTQALRV